MSESADLSSIMSKDALLLVNPGDEYRGFTVTCSAVLETTEHGFTKQVTVRSPSGRILTVPVTARYPHGTLKDWASINK